MEAKGGDASMSDSTITKRAIAAGLKELMEHKPFEKIAVSDIAKHCGPNRQTFYYHFQDKYELVNWIYYQEIVLTVTRDLALDNWDERVEEVLHLMEHSASFYQCTLQVSGQNAFRDYLFSITQTLFAEAIRDLDRDHGVSEADGQFIASFYAHGLVGIVVTWARQGMHESAHDLAQHLKTLVEDSRKIAVRRLDPHKAEPAPNAC